MPRRRDRAEQPCEILSPFDLAKKLRGAVQARDMKTLERLFQRAEVSELDDRSVAFVVRTAVEQHNSSAMALLFSQPAVLTMGPRAIAGLLQTAIHYKNVPAVLQLSKLNGAHNINRAYLSYLLEEAIELGAGAVQSLSVLQGHQTELEQLVPAGSIEGALRTAVLQGRRQMVYHMTQHEQVQGMDPSNMAGIISAAICHHSGVITRYLCWVDAAQRLPPVSVGALLEAALQVDDSQAVHYLCDELPGAQLLDADVTVKLLLIALRQPDSTMFCRISQLPSAQGLEPARIAGLLQSVLSDDAACSVKDIVCVLCELIDGAQRITPERVLELLRVALGQHDSATVGYLCNLPAAQQLSAADCLQLLQLAAHQPGSSSCGSSSRSSSPCRSSNTSRSSSPSPSSSPGGRSSRSSSCSSSSSSCCSTHSSSSSELVEMLWQQLSGAQQLHPKCLERLLHSVDQPCL